MPTVTVALICHDDRMQLRRKIYEISCWTRQPNELIVLGSVDGLETIINHVREDSRPKMPVTYVQCPDKRDKGYDKRAHALRIAKSDFIWFVNYDDVHDFHGLEKLTAEIQEDTKIVYCRIGGKYGHRYGDKLVPYNSGAENHIIRISYALERGGYEPCIAAHKKDDRPADLYWLDAMRTGCQPSEIRFVDEMLIVLL